MRIRSFAPQIVLNVLIFVTFGLLNRRYWDSGNISPLLQSMAILGLPSVGVGMTLIAGEFDLSIGVMAATAGVTAVSVAHLSLLLAFLLPIAGAAAYGAVQGYVIARFEISSLLVTLASLIGLGGLALVIANEGIRILPNRLLSFADILSESFGVFTPISLVAIAVFAFLGIMLTWSRWGREIVAAGSGRTEAKNAGIPTIRPLVIAFAVSATTASIAGVFVGLANGAASPNDFPNTLISAVTAVLIGGVAFEGGRGNVINVFLGVLALSLVTSGVTVLGAPIYAQMVILGGLLLVVLLLEVISGSISSSWKIYWHSDSARIRLKDEV
jgi:ribose/xylose/arabinose/galactoside ABC-type transport system permease subunit